MNRKRIKTELLVHDLKNPLAVIEAGITSLIRKGQKYGPLTDEHLKVLNRALRNTKVAKGLVNDVLEVGRSDEGIMCKDNFLISDFIRHPLVEIFDLTDYETAERISACVKISDLKELLSDKGILLEMDERMWKQEVCMDERKMRQILRNLLSNALKYRKEEVVIAIGEKGGSLHITVSDDGEGIEEEYHQKIFECYFQLDDVRDYCIRGHGIGLAGVLMLVEDMGGNLSLEGGERKGAKFSVILPLGRK